MATIYDPNKGFNSEQYDNSKAFNPNMGDKNLGVYGLGILVIDGVEMPECAVGYPKFTITTTVDAGRNTLNTVVGRKIGRDSIKLEFKFPPLTASEVMNILNILNTGLEHSVNFYHPVHGWVENFKLYMGDRTGYSFSQAFDINGNPTYTVINDFGFNLIDMNKD